MTSQQAAAGQWQRGTARVAVTGAVLRLPGRRLPVRRLAVVRPAGDPAILGPGRMVTADGAPAASAVPVQPVRPKI
jgi:hypothetical protein